MEFKLNLAEALSIMLIAQLIGISIVLMVKKTGKQRQNILLGLFLLSKALCLSSFLSTSKIFWSLENFPSMILVGAPFGLLWGPLLYLYIRSLLPSKPIKRSYLILHLTPFIFYFIYFSISFYFHSPESKKQILFESGFLQTPLITVYNLVLYLTTFAYLLSCMLLIAKSFYANSIEVQKKYLKWMVIVIAGFFLKWIFDVWAISSAHFQTPFIIPITLSFTSLFVFINIIIYIGLGKSEVFAEMSEITQKRQSFSIVRRQQYKDILEEFMEIDRPYLDPYISQESFSERINLPSRSISEIIKLEYNQNFNEFINSYRIAESQRLLAERTKNRTVLDIMFESGFNSKSAFNKAFKKVTQLTPSEYRKTCLLQQG